MYAAHTFHLQEVAWFDRPENQAGILTARLATEVQSLHRVTGTQLSTFLECLSLVITALVIAFYYNWALSLIALAFVPALFFAGTLQVLPFSLLTVMSVARAVGKDTQDQ